MKTDQQFLGDSWLNPLFSDQSLELFSLNQEFPVREPSQITFAFRGG